MGAPEELLTQSFMEAMEAAASEIEADMREIVEKIFTLMDEHEVDPDKIQDLRTEFEQWYNVWVNEEP